MLDIKNLLFSLPAIYLAIVPHEIAHGYIAYKNGDSTAKNMGRLSLNPVKHFDVLGFISMIIFKFGWAKPVPVNSSNFRDYRKGLRRVALAGPLTNLIISVFFTGILKAYGYFKYHNELQFAFATVPGIIILNIIMYNVVLGVFNLLPLPPLDGSNILRSFLSWETDSFFRNNERVLSLITMMLIFSGVTGRIIFPISNKILIKLLG